MRRGLINLGGTVLKTLLGPATVNEVDQLHETFALLQTRNSDIHVVHSLANRLTYVNKLDTLTKINVDALTNLSSILKDTIVQSHYTFQQLTRDIIWLNVTIYNQSEVYMTIRQLDFALLQLFQQVNELVAAVHYVFQGKLLINVIDPTTLYNILRNVFLHLPENYELIAGNKIEDIHSYYELAEVAAIGDTQRIKLIINIPLKSANRHFVLYKTIALPTRITEDKFVKYVFD